MVMLDMAYGNAIPSPEEQKDILLRKTHFFCFIFPKIGGNNA